MPSLSDTLDRLAKETDLISSAAWHNEVPSGPFTNAMLEPDVLHLIRESDAAERQPFRNLIDDEYTAATMVAGPSKPALRTSVNGANQKSRGKAPPPSFLMTPLRELPKKKDTPEELEATLLAVQDVIASLQDSYPLKRARNEWQSLSDKHDAYVFRLAELQKLIADASQPRAKETPVPQSPTPAKAGTPKKPVSIEEALAAEEEALKALEATLAPLRREHALRNSVNRSPASPKSPRVFVPSVHKTPSKTPLRTPFKTPRSAVKLPAITSSLVTPSRTPGSRPSETTPGAASSDLRDSTGPGSIFGLPRKTMTPARMGALSAFNTPGRRPAGTPAPARATPAPPTPVFPTPLPPTARDPTPARPEPERQRTPTPTPPSPAPPTDKGLQLVEGVEVAHPAIPAIIVSRLVLPANGQDQIWVCLSNIMKMGSAKDVPRTPEATV